MDALKHRVINFLEDYVSEYLNPHGVSVMLFDDLTVYVQASFAGYACEDDTEIEFICVCDSLEELFEIFEIKDLKDLGRIKLPVLRNLYLEGIAKVFCIVGDFEMTFQKKGGCMEVSDYRGNTHELNGLLYSAGEFVEYTRAYYKFEKTNSE